MNYVPRPIPTEDITLPDDLLQLTEKLAENAHDHWASSASATAGPAALSGTIPRSSTRA